MKDQSPEKSKTELTPEQNAAAGRAILLVLVGLFNGGVGAIFSPCVYYSLKACKVGTITAVSVWLTLGMLTFGIRSAHFDAIAKEEARLEAAEAPKREAARVKAQAEEAQAEKAIREQEARERAAEIKQYGATKEEMYLLCRDLVDVESDSTDRGLLNSETREMKNTDGSPLGIVWQSSRYGTNLAGVDIEQRWKCWTKSGGKVDAEIMWVKAR